MKSRTMHLDMPGKERKVILLEENFRAPRDRLFRVWTEPDYLRKWFFAEEGWMVNDARVELEAGGTYSIDISSGTGPSENIPIWGSFLDVVAPDLLSYTWNTGALEGRETFVVARFFENGDGSRLVLSHGLFRNARESDLHADGWRKVLERLQSLLQPVL